MKTWKMVLIPMILGMAVLIVAAVQPAEDGVLYGVVTEAETGAVLPGVNVVLKDIQKGKATDINGRYEIKDLPPGRYTVTFSFIGYTQTEKRVRIHSGKRTELNVQLTPGMTDLEEVVVTGEAIRQQKSSLSISGLSDASAAAPPAARPVPQDFNTEDYGVINENTFKKVTDSPLSTFSIDVDAASYSNLRRFIREGRVPPKDAVRIEEMINYFVYDYPAPEGDQPFSVITDIGTAPWNPQHRLVHIGLQGKPLPEDERPASNLVFLLDVSGSMNSPAKLPLLKKAFRMLTDELTEKDRVAIAVYAGAAGLVLPSTSGDEKGTILEAINRLAAGGSTAGAAGIKLAYQEAQKHFIKGGNNRVILATDGDFNVGMSSDAELVRLIEEKREEGTFLTVLGFGTGNLKDNKMEQLANKGNGNYYYIDGPLEAKKVLVSELGSTLFTIAKDVKIQVEFNPAEVAGYRLIGYENRLLANEDFNDDTKDAGELGAGHTVTALYEVIPAGVEMDLLGDVDDLKYQDNNPSVAANTGELMTVKLRYKAPDGDTSQLLERPVMVPEGEAVTSSDNFYFSAAVAAFGMILRDSEYKGTATTDQVLALARDAQGDDREGYRAEFIRLVEDYQDIINAGGDPTASR